MMSPEGCTATPVGRCSWPGVRPRTPKRLLNSPSLEKICNNQTFLCWNKRLEERHTTWAHDSVLCTWTHWLLLSAISILPMEEAATPWRLVNSPLFLPFVPEEKGHSKNLNSFFGMNIFAVRVYWAVYNLDIWYGPGTALTLFHLLWLRTSLSLCRCGFVSESNWQWHSLCFVEIVDMFDFVFFFLCLCMLGCCVCWGMNRLMTWWHSAVRSHTQSGSKTEFGTWTGDAKGSKNGGWNDRLNPVVCGNGKSIWKCTAEMKQTLSVFLH